MTDEERKLSDLIRLRHALRAMSKALRKALLTGTFDGTGTMMVKNYQRLHAKAMELFPDDFFIETMQLEVENVDDHAQLTQVQLVTEQLSNYVESLIQELNPASSLNDVEDLRALGVNLRDQIIRMTKNTLRNALINIDFGEVPEPPHPPQPPTPPGIRRKIKINIEGDAEGDDFSTDFEVGKQDKDDPSYL